MLEWGEAGGGGEEAGSVLRGVPRYAFYIIIVLLSQTLYSLNEDIEALTSTTPTLFNTAAVSQTYNKFM